MRPLLSFAVLVATGCQKPAPLPTAPSPSAIPPTASATPPASASSAAGPATSSAAPFASTSSAPPTPAPSASAPETTIPEQFRNIPKEFSVGVDLMVYLASLNTYKGVFDANLSVPADVPRIATALAPEVVFTDVNKPGKIAKFSREEIAKQLTERRGDAFVVLMHLGKLLEFGLRHPRPQDIRSLPVKDGYTIELVHWYKLTFRGMEDAARVERVDYLMLEGE